MANKFFVGSGSGLPYIVANLRLRYHSNAIDLNNVLNQLKIRSDEKAEEIAKQHAMTIFEDIFPRLNIDVDKTLSEP